MIIKGLNKLREFLWNFPVTLERIYSQSKPLSSILIFGLLSIYLFTLFSSPTLYGQQEQVSKNSTYTEGLIGKVNSLNPMFITGSDTDRAMHSLLYTKLVDFRDGRPQPAFATEWQILPDGKSVKFILRNDMYWHDGVKMDADDVVYSVKRSQELAKAGFNTYGSNLTGVNVIADSENSVTFSFQDVIGGVYETLSIYILPEHVLTDIENSSLYDYGKLVLPIGSGPYEAARVELGDVLLERSSNYYMDVPISKIEFLFFDDIEAMKIAFQNNLLDGMGNIDPSRMDILDQYPTFKVATMNIPQRKKVLFLNMRNEKMKNDNLRYAISSLINKEMIVDQFNVAFQSTNSTIASSSWAYRNDVIYYEYNKESAIEELSIAGYKYDETTGMTTDTNGAQLTFDLVYLDAGNNDLIVEEIERMFTDLGINLVKRAVSYQSLVNEVFATRNFDVLMTELEVTNDPDQYDIWHSSKVNFPDLNLSGYEYDRMDLLLEDARIETNKKLREEDYYQAQRYLALDVPVVPLYEPSYSLIIKEKYTNIQLGKASFPFERFWNITNWEVE